MNNVIEWSNLKEEPINVQLKEQLEKQKTVEEYDINSLHGDDKLDLLRKLEFKYATYEEKINIANQIIGIERYVYMKNLLKMDCNEDISLKNKLKMMISYGVLVEKFIFLNRKSINEIFMLSLASADLNIEEYGFYMEVLCDDEISKSIVQKEKTLNEQVKLAKQIMHQIDQYQFDILTPENFKKMRRTARIVVFNHQTSSQKRK